MSSVSLSPKQLEELRGRRLRAGLTQLELAKRLRVASQYVNMIESGKKSPSLELLARLGNELGLEITVRTVVTIKPKKRIKGQKSRKA